MSDRRREIDELRRQIAEADAQIVEMLRQRIRLSRQAGDLSAGSPASFQHGRDQIDALVALATDELSATAIRAVFQEIVTATGERRAPLTVAYVGPEGGSCHAVAREKFGLEAPLVGCSTLSLAFEEVQRSRAAVAVFAMESSLDGLHAGAIAALAASELALVGKFEATAQLQLMSTTGARADIQAVHAFPGDASACSAELATLRITTVPASSPREAAERAALDARAAALVPEATGLQVGLVTARANVRDAAHPRVRYGLASVRPAPRTGGDITALLVAVHAKPRALFDALKPFAERELDVTCVHACPHWDDGWRYRFYVEVTGHVTDRALVTALEAVKREARMVRVLGSFPFARAAERSLP